MGLLDQLLLGAQGFERRTGLPFDIDQYLDRRDRAPAPQSVVAAAPAPAPAAPLPAQAAPQQRRGFLGGFFGPEGRDMRQRLAMGLEGMTLNPNKALIQSIQSDMQSRKQQDAVNRTAAWLEAQGQPDLASAVRSGLIDGSAAYSAMTGKVEAEAAKKEESDARNRTADVLDQVSPGAGALIREGLVSPSDALGIYRDKRAMDIAKQASEALARGDYQTAYALSLQLSPQAAGQAIAQQYGPRNPEVTGGGMYTVTYENGVPKVTVNTDVQNAELERIRTEAEIRRDATPKSPPTAVIKAEEEDFAAIDTIDQLNQGLDVVIEDFGYDPASGEFKGPLADGFGASGAITGLVGGYTGFSEGASETARARERFERWKTSYVNDSLQLNKGVQTEGDAQRAAAELQGASTAAAAYAALQDLVRINQNARAIKERAISGRRQRYGLDPTDVPAAVNPPDLGWRVVE